MHLLDDRTCDPFPGGSTAHDEDDRADAHRAIALSAVGLALTGFAELTIAVLSGSVGLLGDALHNLADVSTSAVVFVGFRLSRRPASEGHPYGWERAEDIAGIGVALVIWASAVVAGALSVHKLLQHGRTSHLGFGAAAAVVGMVGNQVVARYKGRVGRRIRSATLVADAQHSWLDAVASGGALLGIVGVAAGLRWADAVAGLLVTAFIVHVGYEVTRELLQHLTDGVDPSVLRDARDAAGKVAEVEHVHVRARWMGRSLVVEVEGYVPPGMSVAASETLGAQVEGAVAAAVPAARAVTWHSRASR